jgi:hypothetical protein
VRRKVASTFAKLERVLAEIDPERGRSKPDVDTWCVQEIVNHLTVSLEPGVDQLQALIDGGPPGDAIAAGLIESDALTASWWDSLERLAAAHAGFLEAVDRALEDPPLPDRTVPAVLLIKVDSGSGAAMPLEWMESLDWKSFALLPHVHTLEHLDQIGRIQARLSPPI